MTALGLRFRAGDDEAKADGVTSGFRCQRGGGWVLQTVAKIMDQVGLADPPSRDRAAAFEAAKEVRSCDHLSCRLSASTDLLVVVYYSPCREAAWHSAIFNPCEHHILPPRRRQRYFPLCIGVLLAVSDVELAQFDQVFAFLVNESRGGPQNATRTSA